MEKIELTRDEIRSDSVQLVIVFQRFFILLYFFLHSQVAIEHGELSLCGGVFNIPSYRLGTGRFTTVWRGKYSNELEHSGPILKQMGSNGHIKPNSHEDSFLKGRWRFYMVHYLVGSL